MEEYMTQKGFRCTLFSENIDTGRCGVIVNLTDSEIECFTPEGQRYSIPYQLLKIENIEHTGKIFKISQEGVDFHFISHDKKLLKKIRHAGTENVTSQVNTIKEQKRNIFLRNTIIIGAVLVSLVGLYLLIPVLFNSAISLLPREWDEQLGIIGKQEMQSEYSMFNDRYVQNSIEEILVVLEQNVDPEDEWPFEIFVVNNDITNAFALPGGSIFVFTGLIAESSSAEEVAGVIAHEMGHIINRHGIKRIAQSIGTLVIIQLIFGNTDGFTSIAREFLTAATINNYSQSQEREADETSVILMHKAGLNPLALSEFFYRLKEQGEEVPAYLSWLSTHPSHDDRINAIENMVIKLPETSHMSLDVDWDEVKKRIVRTSR
jgi:beta-barrel assembly-enhancing protease